VRAAIYQGLIRPLLQEPPDPEGSRQDQTSEAKQDNLAALHSIGIPVGVYESLDFLHVAYIRSVRQHAPQLSSFRLSPRHRLGLNCGLQNIGPSRSEPCLSEPFAFSAPTKLLREQLARLAVEYDQLAEKLEAALVP
jgi:hypothetical protein